MKYLPRLILQKMTPNVGIYPIGSMYAIYIYIYGNIYHQYTPNVSIYPIHGSYGIWIRDLTNAHVYMIQMDSLNLW